MQNERHEVGLWYYWSWAWWTCLHMQIKWEDNRGRGRAWDEQSSILRLSPGFMINLQSLGASVSPSMKLNLDSLV